MVQKELLHGTAAEWCGGATSRVQEHVAVSRTHVSGDDRHHANLRSHAVVAGMGRRKGVRGRVGAVVCHFRGLRAHVCPAYLSVYGCDCDDFQRLLPRLPRNGERNRSGVRVAGSFHCGIGEAWSRRARRSRQMCMRGVSSTPTRGRSTSGVLSM